MSSSFVNLVLNENMKIYRRIRTWIMISILVVISILLPFLFSFSTGFEQPNVWEVTIISMTISFFLNMIFVVVIAADSVAGEFSWGTIKLLLIRPWKRSKILLSKYVSIVLFSLLTTIILFGITFLSSNIWFSYGGSAGMTSGAWSDMNFTLMSLLLKYVELVLIATIAFMVSSVFRASGLAIGLSLFIMFTKDIFTTLFNPDNHEWMKYLIFTHMDLSGYMNSSVGPGGSTLTFSISVLAAYYICFLLLSWFVFKKRDVSS
ncbi:ABC-2 type transport system permease protein [Paenibacillus sp. DS2015]|uniref:ABC transporter permease n=1 Tax=Paenibacillus sp. DS2015 TaxID=3373917 RepID=UPI003D1F4CA4